MKTAFAEYRRSRSALRAETADRRRLARDLSLFATPAERQELLAVLSRAEGDKSAYVRSVMDGVDTRRAGRVVA